MLQLHQLHQFNSPMLDISSAASLSSSNASATLSAYILYMPSICGCGLSGVTYEYDSDSSYLNEYSFSYTYVTNTRPSNVKLQLVTSVVLLRLLHIRFGRKVEKKTHIMRITTVVLFRLLHIRWRLRRRRWRHFDERRRVGRWWHARLLDHILLLVG